LAAEGGSDRGEELPGQVFPALLVGLSPSLLITAFIDGFFAGAAFPVRGGRDQQEQGTGQDDDGDCHPEKTPSHIR